MNAIMIQQVYPGWKYEEMLELTRRRHEAYCNRWSIDYQALVDNVEEAWPPDAGGWAKILLVKAALLKKYEYVFWIDADAVVYDLAVDMREAVPFASSIGACVHRIPQWTHWNVGCLYFHAGPGVLDFVGRWAEAYPGEKDGWFEQGVFNRMGREGRIVQTISDRWNATLGVNMVPDPVVIGFHGKGDATARTELMRATLREIERKEG